MDDLRPCLWGTASANGSKNDWRLSQPVENLKGRITMNEKDDEWIIEALKFRAASVEACEGKKRGTVVEFKCPLCGGRAIAKQSTYNGHIHSQCNSCEIKTME